MSNIFTKFYLYEMKFFLFLALFSLYLQDLSILNELSYGNIFYPQVCFLIIYSSLYLIFFSNFCDDFWNSATLAFDFFVTLYFILVFLMPSTSFGSISHRLPILQKILECSRTGPPTLFQAKHLLTFPLLGSELVSTGLASRVVTITV